MQQKTISVGPFDIGTSVENILTAQSSTVTAYTDNAGAVALHPKLVIKQITVVNGGDDPVDVSVFVGAPGGNAYGTELGFSNRIVAAGDMEEWTGTYVMPYSKVLTATASVNSMCTIVVTAELGWYDM